MKLTKKLQECQTVQEADKILNKLKAGPSARKLIETAILLEKSGDPQQKEHAYSFMQTAIKEMEDEDKHRKMKEEEEDEEEDHEMQEERHDDKEHQMREEELDNHNNGPREEGSEQSSDNTEPYPGTAKDSTSGEKPMQDMDNTINQWSETRENIPPMAAAAAPPPMPEAPMGNGVMPGLAPDVAQEMGMVLPKLPPMDTNQMMRQMQYTLNNYHKRIVGPILKQNRQMREAIKTLSIRIQETEKRGGSMKLDVDKLRKNATATFRETAAISQQQGQTENHMFHGQPLPSIQPQHTRRKDKLDTARSEIAEMDRIIRTGNSIYT